MTLTVASLCTGAGGLDLAAQAVLGDVGVAWVADSDPDASAVIAARFSRVPNLGDITAVNWRKVQAVDVLVAGYPCTDLSNAGKRAGIEGPNSGIWRNVAHAIRVLRPRLVMLENVAAHLARGFGRVVGDLAAIGYDTRWMCLRASDIGAPHRRDRVFILAAPADANSQPVRLEPVAQRARVGATIPGSDREGPGLSLLPTPGAALGRGSGMPQTELAEVRRADGRRMLDDAVALLPTPAAWEAKRSGPHARYGNGQPQLSSIVTLLPTPRGSEGAKGGPSQRGSSGDLTLTSSVMHLLPTPTATDAKPSRNATANRSHVPASTNDAGWTLHDVAYGDRWGQYAAAIDRWEHILGRPAPEPTVMGKRGGRRLSARFVEWMMGWPDGWVTDLVDNTAALKLCGNGVVPQQGAEAFRQLGGVALTWP